MIYIYISNKYYIYTYIISYYYIYICIHIQLYRCPPKNANMLFLCMRTIERDDGRRSAAVWRICSTTCDLAYCIKLKHTDPGPRSIDPGRPSWGQGFLCSKGCSNSINLRSWSWQIHASSGFINFHHIISAYFSSSSHDFHWFPHPRPFVCSHSPLSSHCAPVTAWGGKDVAWCMAERMEENMEGHCHRTSRPFVKTLMTDFFRIGVMAINHIIWILHFPPTWHSIQRWPLGLMYLFRRWWLTPNRWSPRLWQDVAHIQLHLRPFQGPWLLDCQIMIVCLLPIQGFLFGICPLGSPSLKLGHSFPHLTSRQSACGGNGDWRINQKRNHSSTEPFFQINWRHDWNETFHPLSTSD